MSFPRTALPLCVLAAMFLFTTSGCGKSTPPADTGGKVAASDPVSDEVFNAAAVLVQFRGCEKSRGTTRTRQEALEMALNITRRVRDGEDFYEVASKESEGKEAASGGVLGNFKSNGMIKPVVDTVRALDIGEVSDPVETHFGYYVLLRREVEEEYNASHILLLHADSKPTVPGLKRTREEAIALATEIAAKVADGENFNELALKYSNGPGQKQGGQLGNFTISELPSYFGKVAEQVAGLKIDEVSEPFETEVGVHLVKRQAIPKPSIWLAAKHILVMYQGVERAGNISRTKEEALARIQSVQKKLTEGQSFEDLAREYSDCPSAKNGGDLQRFRAEQMSSAFSKAVNECTIGSYTDIVETEFGFHLIYRYPPL